MIKSGIIFFPLINLAINHKGISFIEVLQNCIVYNDKAFLSLNDKFSKFDKLINLRNNKKLIFGNDNDKGLFLSSNFKLEITYDIHNNYSKVITYDSSSENIIQNLLARFSINSDIFNKYDLNYVQMLGSRSCPFNCTFCYHHMGQKYSERSLDNIFKEIDYLVEKYQVNFFYFLDELLSAKPERLMEFARRLKNYQIYGWAGSFRVTDTTVERLRILKDSKLALMGYGIENINDSILKSMNKRITRAEIERALKAHHEVGLFCTGNIILGDPAETKETLRSSIDYWLSHPEYNLNLIFLMPIPDSKIYRLALEKKLIKDKLKHIRDNFPMVNLTAISDREFYKFQSRIMWMKHKYQQMRKGKLIGVKKDGNYKGKKTYFVSVKCPFCGHTTEHLALDDDHSWFYGSLCDRCASVSKVRSVEVFYENKNLLKRLLNYLSLFIMSYLARFKFYRNNRVAIIKISRKIKSPVALSLNFIKKITAWKHQ